MIAIVATFVACIAVLRGWPGLPMARWLDGVLVVPVVRGLAALTPGHWLLCGLVAAGIGTAMWMGGDMIVVMALGSPEIVALLATVEVAAYLDAAIAVIAAAGAVRAVPLRSWFARAPRPRQRRARPARKAANDDDPELTFALAA